MAIDCNRGGIGKSRSVAKARFRSTTAAWDRLSSQSSPGSQRIQPLSHARHPIAITPSEVPYFVDPPGHDAIGSEAQVYIQYAGEAPE